MTLSHLNTIEAIATDVISKLHEEDQIFIAKHPLENARGMHHSLGQWIRNTYGLWHDNAITERWRTDESSHKIIDGVDYSEDHPDSISDAVISMVWKNLRGISL